jgi:hypothetical protein
MSDVMGKNLKGNGSSVQRIISLDALIKTTKKFRIVAL